MTKAEKFQDTFKSRVYNWLVHHFGFRCPYCFTPYLLEKDVAACCLDKQRAHATPPFGEHFNWAALPYDFWIRQKMGRPYGGRSPIPTRTCPVCNGTKIYRGVTCDYCGGMGKVF